MYGINYLLIMCMIVVLINYVQEQIRQISCEGRVHLETNM